MSIDDSCADFSKELLTNLTQQVNLIKKTHGLSILQSGVASLENYSELFSKIPHQIFQLSVPLFMDITLLKCNDDP